MNGSSPELGCLLPHRALAAEPLRAAEWFRAVEDLGFDYVAGFDHVAGAPREELAGLAFAPYTHVDPFMELLVTLAHGAAVTRRLGLATGVLVLPQRQTVLVAKQLATLSDLSGGRLRVGIGVGWNPAEFAALGVDFGRRGALLDEQVPVVRALWEQETVTARGRHHEWGPVGIAPHPQGRIPLWFGGTAVATLRRVVAWGDGLIPSRADARTGGPPDVRTLLQQLWRLCEEAERARETVGVEGRIDWTGDPDALARSAEEWTALGASHLAVTLSPAIAPDVDAHLAQLDRSLARLRSLVGLRAPAGHGELTTTGVERT